MAERTAIIKPRKVDNSRMPMSKLSGKVDIKASAEAAIPEIGCVMC